MEDRHSREEHDKGSPSSPPSDSSPTENSQNDKRTGRRKIKIEFIEDKSRRHITFSKRKHGIMKKAYELSTLTGTQVLLLVASETGHVYTFATHKLQPLITKPEGKNLIQACLSTPDPAGGTQSPNPSSQAISTPTPPSSQPSNPSSQSHKASSASNTQTQAQQSAPSQQTQQSQPQQLQSHSHQLQHPHQPQSAFSDPALTYNERPEEVYDEEKTHAMAKERVKQEQANKAAPFPNFGMEGIGAGQGGYPPFSNPSFAGPSGYPGGLIPGGGGPGMYVSSGRFGMPPSGYAPYPSNNPGPYPASSQPPHNMGPYGFLPISQNNNNPKPPHPGAPK